MANDTVWFVKIRCDDMKRFEFLTPRGGLTSKKFHASMFMDFDSAWRVAEAIVDDPLNAAEGVRSVCVQDFHGKRRKYVNH